MTGSLSEFIQASQDEYNGPSDNISNIGSSKITAFRKINTKPSNPLLQFILFQGKYRKALFPLSERDKGVIWKEVCDSFDY